MSCKTLGNPCKNSGDCIIASDNDSCLNILCSKNTCTSTTCSTDDDCTSKFGDGFTCDGSKCISISCNSTKKCPSGMTCGPNAVCTSLACNGMGDCPSGMQCKKMADGSRKCISRPGFSWDVLILVDIMMLVTLIIVVFAVYYSDTIAHFLNE